MSEIRTHTITLCGRTAGGWPVALSPLTEAHWPHLYRWYSDPEVLFFTEGDNVSAYSAEDVRGIYYDLALTRDGYLRQVHPC